MRNMAWCSSCLNTGRDHKRASTYGGRSHPEVNDNLDTTRVCLQIQGQRLPALVRFGSLWDQLPTVQLPNNPVSLGTRSQKGRGSLKVSMEFGNNGKMLIWQHASFTNGGGCFFWMLSLQVESQWMEQESPPSIGMSTMTYKGFKI